MRSCNTAQITNAVMSKRQRALFGTLLASLVVVTNTHVALAGQPSITSSGYNGKYTDVRGTKPFEEASTESKKVEDELAKLLGARPGDTSRSAPGASDAEDTKSGFPNTSAPPSAKENPIPPPKTKELKSSDGSPYQIVNRPPDGGPPSIQLGSKALMTDPQAGTQTEVKVVRKLGSGAGGDVWLVEADGTQFAVKILKPSGPGSNTPLETSMMVAEVNSDHLLESTPVTISVDGRAVTALKTEVVEPLDRDSMSLSNYLNLTAEQKTAAINDLYVVGRSLKALADDLQIAGVVHRDIKPGNAGVVKDGTIVLFDNDTMRGENNQNDRPATPSFAAPEVVLNGHSYATDRFATGATLFDLLTNGATIYRGGLGLNDFSQGGSAQRWSTSPQQLRRIAESDGEYQAIYDEVAGDLRQFAALVANDPTISPESKQKLQEVIDDILVLTHPDPSQRWPAGE